MFYTIAILVIFSVTLIIFDRKNRYSLLFVMMAVGCTMAFFSVVLHINMFGNYYFYSQSVWFNLDYRIYSYLVRHIRLSLAAGIRIMNIGQFLYLLSMPLFSMEVRRSMSRYTGQKVWTKILNGLCFALPFFTLLFCDPQTSTRLYIFCQKNPFRYAALENVTLLYKALVILAVLSPVVLLIRYSFLLSVPYLQRRILFLAICLFSLDCGFVGFFYVGPFGISAEKVLRSGFWIFENIQLNSQKYYIWLPTITIVLLSFCMVMLLNFRLDFSATVFLNKKVYRNLRMMNEILGDTLHSQKNMLFTLQLLTDKAQQKATGECREELDNLRSLVARSLENTAKMLDNLRNVEYRFINNDLLKILEEACGDVCIPENIKLEMRQETLFSQYGLYDKYHLEKAFVNILNNAVEAIGQSGSAEGCIRIEMAYFFRWAVVILTDNGTGIPRSVKKKLFLPHYSNKNGHLNWGLGLSYVYKVVKAHYGQIKIDSKCGEYTSVLIMLPMKGREPSQ